MREIIIVDDELDMCKTVARLLEEESFSVKYFLNGEDLISYLQENPSPDLILLDQRMTPHMDGINVLKKIKEFDGDVPVIILTAYAEVESAVKAMKLGASDFILKPFEKEALLHRIEQAIEKTHLLAEIENLRLKLEERDYLELVMGTSPEIRAVHQAVEKVTNTDFSVLIYGETGTGKEIIARAIHDYSRRQDKPFVAVDCGAIPPNLIESELFGYTKGAFTGAHETRDGRFQQAQGGTIFLDEISNLSYGLQKKILRVVQERQVQKIGSTKLESIDVRILSATNQPLDEMVAKGKFRKDVYYRLNEFTIKIPLLRQRKDDILLLATRFLKEAEQKVAKGRRRLSHSALIALQKHNWPGNVRELQNVIRRAVLVSTSVIKPEHLALKLDGSVAPELALTNINYEEDMDLKSIKKKYFAEIEKRVIENVLKKFNSNKSRTARYLKIDYKTLLTKIEDYGIESIISSL